MRDHFISIQINAEKGEGINLKEQYAIPGYPTMIFLDSLGREIDRIIGYRPPEAFLAKVDSVSKNLGTVPALEIAVSKDPTNAKLWKRLAAKYEARGSYISASRVWDTLADLKLESPDLVAFKSTSLQAKNDKRPEPLVDFILENPDNPYLKDAYSAALSLYRKVDAPEAEGDLYLRYVTYMENQGLETPGLFNGFAWRMTEIQQHLEEALTKINQAIDMIQNEKAETRAQIMDTKAEVLWKLGRIEDAVAVIDQCIALQPEDPYYLRQKDKFLGKS